MRTVSSVLCESTRTISSAKPTEDSASAMPSASFLVMTVTESFGTDASVTDGAGFPARPLLSNNRRSAGLNRAGAGEREVAGAVDRHFLHRLEVDDRLVVIGDRLNFRDARGRE